MPDEQEVRFYFNHLRRHRFETEHTADCAHSTQVLDKAFNLLKFALNSKD